MQIRYRMPNGAERSTSANPPHSRRKVASWEGPWPPVRDDQPAASNAALALRMSTALALTASVSDLAVFLSRLGYKG